MLPILPFDTIKHQINQDFDLSNNVDLKSFTRNAKAIYNAKSTKEIFDKFGFKNEPKQYTVKTYYDQDVFQSFEKVKNTLYTREAKEADEKLNTAVQNQLILTKHRIVFVDGIQGFQTTNGTLAKQPFSFALTTACAPNAMNLNSVDIPVYFSDEQFKLGLPLYREIMELTYRRCIEIQKANNVDVFIIPPLGLGVYLKTLDNKQKETVIGINYQALFSTCKNIESGSLKQIICTIPSNKGSNNCFNPAQHARANYKGNIPIEITKTDALETAELLSKHKYKVSVVVPGSFSTVGGAYKILPHNDKLQPKEESDYQATNAAQVIPMNTNEGSTTYEYHNFTNELVCKNEALYKTKNTSDSNSTQADRIQKWLNIDESINIIPHLDYKSRTNYQVKFSKFVHANQFADQLASIGIKSMHNENEKKTVSDNSVYLSAADATKLEKYFLQPQKNFDSSPHNTTSITSSEIKQWLRLQEVQLANDIEIKGVVDINTNHMNTGVYFNEKQDAYKFVNALTTHGIMGRNGPKFVHKTGNYVILTNNDIKKLKNTSTYTEVNCQELTKEQMIDKLTKINNKYLEMEPENKNWISLFSPCWTDKQIELIKSEKAKYYQLLTEFLTHQDIDNDAKTTLLIEVTTQKNIINCHVDPIHVGNTTTHNKLDEMIKELGIQLPENNEDNNTLSPHMRNIRLA